MMKLPMLLLSSLLLLQSCEFDDDDGPVQIPNFNFATSVTFKPALSDYNLYQGDARQLIASDQGHAYELSSHLFTDYAHKQRLLFLPDQTTLTALDDGLPNFPDGSILSKTFYYLSDERSANSEKQLIETRLLIKQQGIWNAATYLWNDQQDEAYLIEDRQNIAISWLDASGQQQSTEYVVPSK